MGIHTRAAPGAPAKTRDDHGGFKSTYALGRVPNVEISLLDGTDPRTEPASKLAKHLRLVGVSFAPDAGRADLLAAWCDWCFDVQQAGGARVLVDRKAVALRTD